MLRFQDPNLLFVYPQRVIFEARGNFYCMKDMTYLVTGSTPVSSTILKPYE
jgi:hypothetical protein